MLLRNISEGDAGALLCITDSFSCCRYYHRAGEWFYPDGRMVPVMTPAFGDPEPYYRNRGYSLIRLNRRPNQGLSDMYTGVYCCQIPDQNYVIQTLCVGAYLTERGSESLLAVCRLIFALCHLFPNAVILYTSTSIVEWNLSIVDIIKSQI